MALHWMRRYGLAACLVIALAIGQQAALRHELAHSAGAASSHDSLPAPAQCGDHGLFAAFAGGMAPAVAPVAIVHAAQDAARPVNAVSAPVAARRPYFSRAPPGAPA